MPQAPDHDVDNGTGAAVRSDMNTRFHALFTNPSGAPDTAISTKYVYQTWADTTAGQLKFRTASNTWVPLRSLTGDVIIPNGSEAAPSISFGRDGPNHGFYRVSGTEANAAGFGFVTQHSGSDHTLFTVGKNLGTSGGDDGPSLYWNFQTNPTATSNTTNEGMIIQKRGRMRISMNNAHQLTLNRVGSGGQELGSHVLFMVNGSQSGRIGSVSTTDVTLFDSSDRRLKDNITDMPAAKTRINQIKMRRFRLIAADNYEEGFIAQELKEICPEAVLNDENTLDENGNIDYMGVGKASLVPLLMKGLQEAYAEIEALTTRVAALEAS